MACSRRMRVVLARVLTGFLVGLFGAGEAHPQSLADYTAYPPFINKTVPPNILFIVDLSNATLPAAYGSYPISRKTGTVTAGKLAANVNLVSAPGLDLVSSIDGGVTVNGATVSTPGDAFDPAKSYYGLFDSLRCYTTDSNSFNYGSVKTTVSEVCGAVHWDGNFLNWLAMRKKDVAYQVLIGGTSLPASSNTDGTANSLASETKTGEDGSTNTCGNNSNPCWRYVKFVPDSTLAGRAPASLPVDAAGSALATPGRFFGSGEGKIYLNSDADADPFDAAPGDQYSIRVDLLTEPDAPSGTGSISGNCTVGDPAFAGHLVCYRRDHSLGLFQKLRTDNMRVAIMFADANGGKGGRVIFRFDDNFNASAITNIRNEGIKSHAPLAEATYEGLCLFRNSQGSCYSNSPADFAASVGAQGDPYYFATSNQLVSCCKSFIIMVSPGVPRNDDNAPDLQAPFADLFTGSQVGLTSTRLDDVAYYGQTHDVRDQASGVTGHLAGAQKVGFYSVNAMGGAAGAGTLASAAKHGGFEDRNGNGAVDLMGQACTYPAGSSLGSGPGTSNAEWDQDKDCIPDTYFEASEGGDLESTVTSAIAEILKRSASGTSVSVLAASGTGEGALYQAYFFPSTFEGLSEVKWTGHTQGLFLDSFGNLREDSDGDGKLVYQSDYIIRTRTDSATSDVLVDRYVDADGDGRADAATPLMTVGLREVQGIWEAGKQLASTASSARKILTWVDRDNDGLVDADEMIPFTTANSATLSPYVRAGAAPFTADNIINFIRGEQISGLRDRQITVSGSLKVWKLGDPLHSTPTVVGSPRERFDVIYGDASYTAFYQQYRSRRQVVYVGANDGMLHAFNAGFYQRGDDPATTTVTEHGWFTRTPSDNSGGPLLGQELWAFIPYQLLPHLKWLTQTDYTHVYYVDLKPKITDARIFTPDADHPNGWGTILIGGFRMGGSCQACTSGKGGPPMTVTADFNGDGDTVDPDDVRTFYSAYFVLDITNPEADPKLLWVFTDPSLGLTTSAPTVLRVNPASEQKTADANARWFMAVGSGVTGYDGSSAQTAQVFAVDLKRGPKDPTTGLSLVTTFSTGDADAFMGNLITLDVDLDFRADAIYGGNTIKNGSSPAWVGKLYRLTTTGCSAAPCSAATWGIASGINRVPTVLLSSFPVSGTTQVGPITAAPTLTMDDSNNTWVFFGTGRFFDSIDKTNSEPQYFIGVKDPVVTGGCIQSTMTDCERRDLVDVSSAGICIVCAGGTDQVTGVAGVTTFDGSGATSLMGLMQSKDGWFTLLPTLGERDVVAPTLIGGTVFFPSFIPVNDVCSAAGDGNLYALFYQTGTAYKESVIGTTVAGSDTNVNRSMALGNVGVMSQFAVHIGAQGTGGSGTSGGGGCQSRMGLIGQSGSGATSTVCGGTGQSWSRYLSWLNQRD